MGFHLGSLHQRYVVVVYDIVGYSVSKEQGGVLGGIKIQRLAAGKFNHTVPGGGTMLPSAENSAILNFHKNRPK